MNAIEVQVQARYLENESQPHSQRYVYSYSVFIINNGSSSAQLISRCWTITDQDGSEQNVQGLGVVGQQPTLKPGERYSYTSGVVLKTPSGTMHGHYTMLAEHGEEFRADIPAFALVRPEALH